MTILKLESPQNPSVLLIPCGANNPDLFGNPAGPYVTLTLATPLPSVDAPLASVLLEQFCPLSAHHLTFVTGPVLRTSLAITCRALHGP